MSSRSDPARRPALRSEIEDQFRLADDRPANATERDRTAEIVPTPVPPQLMDTEDGAVLQRSDGAVLTSDDVRAVIESQRR